MFKKILLAVAVALPLSAMAQKFGTVDIESVFDAMPETAAMTTQLQETSKKYEDEYAKLQEEVNKLYAEFQSIQNDTNTPESIKERRLQEVQDRYAKVQQFRETAQQDLARLEQQLSAPIHQDRGRRRLLHIHHARRRHSALLRFRRCRCNPPGPHQARHLIV